MMGLFVEAAGLGTPRWVSALVGRAGANSCLSEGMHPNSQFFKFPDNSLLNRELAKNPLTK